MVFMCILYLHAFIRNGILRFSQSKMKRSEDQNHYNQGIIWVSVGCGPPSNSYHQNYSFFRFGDPELNLHHWCYTGRWPRAPRYLHVVPMSPPGPEVSPVGPAVLTSYRSHEAPQTMLRWAPQKIVRNGVIPTSRVKSPRLPIDFRPFIGVIIPLITGAHLVYCKLLFPPPPPPEDLRIKLRLFFTHP